MTAVLVPGTQLLKRVCTIFNEMQYTAFFNLLALPRADLIFLINVASNLVVV